MKKEKVKGFTLIEMLVIIAIISILLGVVLVALPKVRQYARDARITSDLIQLQNLAENIYLDEGNYDNLDSAPEIAALENDIFNQGSQLVIQKSSSPADKYCAYAPLNQTRQYSPTDPVHNMAFCVDYLFKAREVSAPEKSCNDACQVCMPCLDQDGDGWMDSTEAQAMYASGWDPSLDLNCDGLVDLGGDFAKFVDLLPYPCP